MPEPAKPPRRFQISLGAAVGAIAVFAACLAWKVGGEKMVVYVSDAGTVLAPMVATLACLRAGRRQVDRFRRFWWLLAAACGSWMFGEMIWTAYDLAGNGGPPVPSLADIGYLAFIPLVVLALLGHPALKGSGVRKARSLLDGLSIGIGLLFVSWTFVLGPLWRASDLSTLGGLITFAYPVGDVLIGFIVMLGLRRTNPEDRLELWCLLAGLTALALADSTYAYTVEVKGYQTGHLLDTGWFAGFLAVALGARASNARHLVPIADSPWSALPALTAPLLPVLTALIVASFRFDPDRPPDWIGIAMVFALILLALARQTLLVMDFVATGPTGEHEGVADRLASAVLGRSGTMGSGDEASPPRKGAGP